MSSEYELELAAEEEIERALDLSWRELSRCIPWGDTYEGFTPGGDILCEVAVYEDPARFEKAARRSRIIPKSAN